MKATPLLCLFALLLFSSFNLLHSGLDQYESYHASILAKHNQYELSDWDLGSTVASMKVSTFSPGTEPEPYFNMLYQFDQRGRLIFWMQGDSTNSRHNYQYRKYAFGEAGQLQKVTQYEKHQNAFIMTKAFDKQGYLSEISYLSKMDSSLDFRTHIQYSEQHTKMSIAYKYGHPQTHYERRKTEN
ncbi:MAG: hypothetical protein AAFN10_17265, partial [Bacteroidota bacterium]